MAIEHPPENRPVMYLSGLLSTYSQKEVDRWYRKTGCRHRCFSFAYACPGAFYYRRQLTELDMTGLKKVHGHIMMDSGGFSFIRFAGSHNGQISMRKKLHFSNVEQFREESIKLYIQYCKEHGKEWDFYVNADYIRSAPRIFEMQTRLERSGISPMPIYHGDATIDWFRRYLDGGYRRIGISGSGGFKVYRNFRMFLDRVFNEAEKAKQKIKFHGFALTAPTLMTSYPWYSVDTASWVKTSAYGCIYVVDPHMYTAGTLSVSDRVSPTPGGKRSAASVFTFMPREQQENVRQQIEEAGFDFDALKTSLMARLTYNGYYIVHLFDTLKAMQPGREHKPIRWGSLL